ncbi:hypothetical protein CHUAL_001106 [Chamberlinius hualienensis]
MEEEVDSEKQVSEVKQFTCPHCPKSYSRNCNLAVHVKRFHKISDSTQAQSTVELSATSSRRSNRKLIPNRELSDFVTDVDAPRGKQQLLLKEIESKCNQPEQNSIPPSPEQEMESINENHEQNSVTNLENESIMDASGESRVSLSSQMHVESDESLPNSSVNLSAIKRGRGRPKKNSVIPAEKPKTLEVSNTLTEEVSENLKPKLRGRRRKVEFASKEAVETVDLEINRENPVLDDEGQVTNVNSIISDTVAEVTDDLGNLKVKRKRGRQRKVKDVNGDQNLESNATAPNENLSEDKSPSNETIEDCDDNEGKSENSPREGKRRGRPRKKPLRGKSGKPFDANMKLDQPIKCSCLMEFTTAALFKNHVLRQHNGLARELGDDRPFEGAEKKQALQESIQLTKKLHCRKDSCGKSFSTVGGYLYHSNVCGKTKEERVINCDICGKILIEASIKPHYKAFHEKKNVNLVLAETENDDGDSSKRKAAKKASEKLSKIIKDGGCDSSSRKSDDEYSAVGDEEIEVESNESESEDEPNEKRSDKSRKSPTILDITALEDIWKEELNRVGFTSCRNEGCCQIEKNVEEMVKHNDRCRFRQTPLYECTHCNYRNLDKERVLKHAAEKHFGVCTDDPDIDLNAYSRSIRLVADGILKIEVFEHRKRNLNFTHFASKHLIQHLKVTTKFFEKNFVKDGTNFPELLPYISHWNRLSSCEYQNCIPKIKTSAEFKIKSSGKPPKPYDSWTKLDMFESLSFYDERQSWKSCFVGGPVKACAWVPTSNLVCSHQYIAVYCHPDPDKKHFVKDISQEPCLIQIWDLGILESGDESKPKLVLGIVDNNGVIWQLRWCPSGCWNGPNLTSKTALPRLGLLAAACADGFVKIYSVPDPSSLGDGNGLPIYRAKPVVVLTFHPDPSFIPNIQCTALSWHEGLSHDQMAGGFTDGVISVWDLKTKSSLLVSEREDKVKILSPFLSFKGHGNVVTGIEICPLHGGRFMVSCSRDRSVKFWDIDDISLPINIIKKRSLNGLRWTPHWRGAFVYSDDCYSMKYNGVALVDVTCTTEYPMNVVSHQSSVFDLSTSYWINAAVSCDESGETALSLFGETPNVTHPMGFKRLPLYRITVENKSTEIEKMTDAELESEENGAFNVSDISEINEELLSNDGCVNRFNYENAEKNFRLVYNDMSLDLLRNLPAAELKRLRSSASDGKPLMDYYPLNSVNRVAWNPNLGAHQWLAIGEHNGIMRFISVFHLDFVPIDEIRKEIIKIWD